MTEEFWGSALQMFLIMHPYQQKFFEQVPSIYVYLLIYRLYTCATVVIYYIHYKTHTKIEIKKDEIKMKETLFKIFILFIGSTNKCFH